MSCGHPRVSNETRGELIAERRRRVAYMTREGKTACEIAAVLGVTDRTVVRDRVALGMAQPYTGENPITDAELDRARVLFADGCSAAEVARTLGRSHNTITRHFPGHGWNEDQCREFLTELRRFEHATGTGCAANRYGQLRRGRRTITETAA